MPGYAKVPVFVREMIESLSTDTFVIARTRSYEIDELKAGKLAHLGVTVHNGQVRADPEALPPATIGRWSRYNVNGLEKTLRDRPKVEKYIGTWEVPYFGDYTRGSTSVSFTRPVFQKEVWYGRGITILIDVQAPIDNKVVIGFRVNQVFDRTTMVERDLLLACSLLRENVGSHASVLSTATSTSEWLSVHRVTWTILPVGTTGPVPFSDIATRLGIPSGSERYARMNTRYDVVRAMNPSQIVVGEGEFSRYFGFKFREDLVALECLDYGNALYLMYEDWQPLSERSRTELLADADANYDRIVHSPNWQEKLRQLLILKGHSPDPA